MSSSLITGLDFSFGMSVSGNDIYVTSENRGNQGVSEYTTAGTLVNPSVIPTFTDQNISDMVMSGNNLFVLTTSDLREYTTSGTVVRDPLVSGFFDSQAIAIEGNDMFITDYGSNSPNSGYVAEYTLSGQVVNARLVSGLNTPTSVAVTGDDLFVGSFSSNGSGLIGEYTTSGATVDSMLIPGVYGIDIELVPEPSAWALALVALGAFVLRRNASSKI